MTKKLKPCLACAELARQRDQLLSYQELYEKTKQEKAALQTSLERAWKLIDQLTNEQKKGGQHD